MTRVPLVKLELRAEGTNWNCYLAPGPAIADRVHERHLLGSIALKVCMVSPAIKEKFLLLMQDALQVTCRESIGLEVSDFEISTPPETTHGSG